jgi:hypothetical protein
MDSHFAKQQREANGAGWVKRIAGEAAIFAGFIAERTSCAFA